MTNYIRIAGLIVAGACLFGCAATNENAKAKPAESAAVVKHPNCLTDTGSRVSSDASKCRGFGRSFSSEDIDRTGKTSAADALGLLDPSITVHH
jgi:hypothetical protein